MKPMGIWMIMGSMAAGQPTTLPPDKEEAAYPAIQRFIEVMETVRKRHPDVDRVAYDRLVNHALEGLLAGLDPYSSFIHPEMAKRMKESPEMNPEIRSLGLSLGLRDDACYVAAVAPGGPAASAGVLPGSTLLEIDEEATTGGDFSQILEALQRPAGAVTRIKLKSSADPKPVLVSLEHRLVEDRSVAEVHFANKEAGIGYLRLASFGSACGKEVEAALDELEDDGMKSLILDLRGNGGGDLGETVKILGLWLAPGTEVVTIRSRDSVESLKTPEQQRRERSYPITVLMDRMSASASELTAGALQDLKRARIVGETSYGKGSVQNIIPMGGGTALRLTIATYHTPSGRTPQHVGISPDVVVSTTEQDRENFQKRCRIDTLSDEERKLIEAWSDPVMIEAEKLIRP